MAHIPVLKEETINSLKLSPSSVVVDCTLGVGGHAEMILNDLGPEGVYVGFDVDPTAIEAVEGKFKGKQHLVCSNFSNIKDELEQLQLKPNAILADLGWRSEQFTQGGKGLSFNDDEPLIMTYGDPSTYTFTAHDIVNDWDEESIADVVYGYGEERAARRIAAAIVSARENTEIKTSGQLAEIVKDAVPKFRHKLRIHPATQTFQALRIAVNDELGVLDTLLTDGFEILTSGGRFSIITFHSLEDRIVKKFFKTKTHDQEGVLVTKKPITASEKELAQNPRARSAKLRTIEKI